MRRSMYGPALREMQAETNRPAQVGSTCIRICSVGRAGVQKPELLAIIAGASNYRPIEEF